MTGVWGTFGAMSDAPSGLEAATAWLKGLDMPPTYDDGAVHYPEGSIPMSPEEYLAVHNLCPHQMQMKAVQIICLTTYLRARGFRGAPRRAALAPIMEILAALTGHKEFEDVLWDR